MGRIGEERGAPVNLRWFWSGISALLPLQSEARRQQTRGLQLTATGRIGCRQPGTSIRNGPASFLPVASVAREQTEMSSTRLCQRITVLNLDPRRSDA